MTRIHRVVMVFGGALFALAACAEGSDFDAGAGSGGRPAESSSASSSSSAASSSSVGSTSTSGVSSSSGGASSSGASSSSSSSSSAGGSSGAGGASALCDVQSCANGCCLNDLCMPGTSNSICGNNGMACEDCTALNHTCNNKTCTNVPQCNQASCPQGCCLGNSCEFGLSDQACGKQGNACINCSAQGQICNNGFCSN